MKVMMMTKKSITKILRFATLATAIITTTGFSPFAWLTQPTASGADYSFDIAYKGLSDDMQSYVTTNRHHHSGDLLDHSIWVADTIVTWFHEQKFWTEGIDATLIRPLAVAGFLHDIGKAGDLETTYEKKEYHPEIGFNYLRGIQQYRMLPDGRPFIFADWFDHNKLNAHEKALVTVLVGIHEDFGLTMMRDVQAGKFTREQAAERYCAKLQQLAQRAHYNSGHLDETLVKCAVLISAADVYGAQYIPCPCTKKFTLPDRPAPHPSDNMYEKYQFDSVGKASRDALLQYATTHDFYPQ